ncbi:MAG: transglycosylase SLT domain-containing protein [Desulfopila sp.]
MLYIPLSFGNLGKGIVLGVVLFIFLVNSPGSVKAAPYKNYFPLFPSIRANVAFWEKVFSTYSGNTAIIHDRKDLSIVYEVVPLLDSVLPGARRLNRICIKGVKKKYSAILDRLATGALPENAEERRILAMFPSPAENTALRSAADNIRTQIGLKERFIDGVIQSGIYLPEIKKILKSQGLPEDLAYLPHVESSFNLQAHSKSGATGIWQFTRSTGSNYLKVDHVIDERRDPLAATYAAAQYLKHGFKKLGSWPLAITGYNYGHAGMLRALKKHGNYEEIFTHYSQGHFKFASRNFYAEFLAARNVAKALENNSAIKRYTPDSITTLQLPGFATVQNISDHFRLSKQELRLLNPALRQSVWHGEKYIPKGYSLRLPGTAQISALVKTLPQASLKSHQKRSLLYTVKHGDTAGEIALRFDISLKHLSSTNNLSDKALVYVGQTLRIAPMPPTATNPPIIGEDIDHGINFEGGIPVLQEKKKSTAG